jgi:hypothetical protein
VSQRIPKPNPEVYRRAAELLLGGDCYYSCIAIRCAARQMGLSYRSILYHKAQYNAMFGPWKGLVSVKDNGYIDINATSTAHRHPFWNLQRTPARQEMRVNALLLMADIVEQGC